MNPQVRTVDDLLDLSLKFEHEDYFNRGLNLMLNPPEGDLLLSEHALGLKIKNTSVTENYTAENKWLVKTSKRDPNNLEVGGTLEYKIKSPSTLFFRNL